MSVADYGAQQWAGIMFNILAPPPRLYVALCTAEPGDGWDGSVVVTIEPADPVYERQALELPGGWTLSDEGFVINAVDLAWPTPTADWGNITHYALLDAPAAGGNLWAYEEFLEAQYIPAGYDVLLPVGSLNFGVSAQLPSIAE